tara:strand:+ start:980 stop:1900 length:921 start_codon:yes stop_codon:yes gene_type:complete
MTDQTPFTVGRRGKAPLITWPDPIGLGGTVRVLLQFDEHWDNPKSEQDLIAQHMQEAVDEGAPIVKGGDTFCAMQGRYDPRRARKDVRPEHDHPDYVDRLVRGYAEFAAFAAPNIAFMGKGNHELGVLKNIETDLIGRTAERLRISGSNVQTGGIGGWILFKVKVTKTSSLTVPIFYHHGHGGGGPVTKGVIQTNRRATYLPDAQVVLTGHVHEEWSVTICRDRINSRTGRIYRDEQLHINTATYKQEYDPAGSTWHSLQGRPPKPIGATWLELTIAKEFDGTPTADGRKSNLPLWKVIPNAKRVK